MTKQTKLLADELIEVTNKIKTYNSLQVTLRTAIAIEVGNDPKEVIDYIKDNT